MTENLYAFIQLIFIGFIALFPVVNPIGGSFMVNPYFTDLSRRERKKVVKKVAFYAFIISAVTLFVGRWVLQLFGLTIPVVQLAGGIMICKIGWEFLSSDKHSDSAEQTSEKKPAQLRTRLYESLFYPITFPMTTGAGTISVLFTLSAHGNVSDFSGYLINVGALLISVIGICILIYFFYVNANRLINYIGSHNEKIVNRLMAFLIFCVGLQIAVEGINNLIKI